LRIYSALGAPEVWLCDGDSIDVYHLEDDGNYIRRDRSLAFPFLPIDQVQRFLNQGKTANETAWIRSFRSWVLRELKP
jgi:Uma2 family endonuclease